MDVTAPEPEGRYQHEDLQAFQDRLRDPPFVRIKNNYDARYARNRLAFKITEITHYGGAVDIISTPDARVTSFDQVVWSGHILEGETFRDPKCTRGWYIDSSYLIPLDHLSPFDRWMEFFSQPAIYDSNGELRHGIKDGLAPCSTI